MYSTSRRATRPPGQASRRGDPRGIVSLISRGGGGLVNYIIHQLEPIAMLMGYEARRVTVIGDDRARQVLIDYGESRSVVLSQQAGLGFKITALLDDGRAIEMEADDPFFMPFIDEMLAFFDGGAPPVSPDETIALMALREAIILAAELPGQWRDVQS